MRRFVILVVLLVSSVASALELKGSFQQGGMLIGQVAPGSKVLLDSKDVKLSSDGVFVVGFGRNAKPKAELLIIKPDGSQQRQQLEIEPREYNIQRIEGISKSVMSPSADTLARIRSEAVEVRRARAKIIDRMDFAGTFQWPLIGPISGVYGSQRVYNGVPKNPHYGVDVAAPTGTPVTTPAPGIITLAHPDMFYSGGTLIIDHGFGVSSTFLHLSEVMVDVGDEVVPGDVVAKVGAGGRATGPHLDWRMNWLKQRIDPQLLVKPMSEAKAIKLKKTLSQQK